MMKNLVRDNVTHHDKPQSDTIIAILQQNSSTIYYPILFGFIHLRLPGLVHPCSKLTFRTI